MTTTGSSWAAVRRAARGDVVRTGARVGFAARGVLYLLVGVLAVRIGLTGTNEQADRGGALTEIAATPFGAALLWALGVGLAGMTVWRLSEALFGSAGPKNDGAGKRALSGARFVFYGVSSFLVLAFAVGDRGSGAGSTDRQSGTSPDAFSLCPAASGGWAPRPQGSSARGCGSWAGRHCARTASTSPGTGCRSARGGSWT